MAVPFSRLADIIEVSKKEMDDLGLFASILGHIGEFVLPDFSAAHFSQPLPSLWFKNLKPLKAETSTSPSSTTRSTARGRRWRSASRIW